MCGLKELTSPPFVALVNRTVGRKPHLSLMDKTVKLVPFITLTDSAAEFYRERVYQRPAGYGIIVGVKTAGCSGLSYTIEYADANVYYGSTEYFFMQHNGVKILMKKEHEVYLKGTELDMVKDGLNMGLKFNNPNSKASCGCGETFTV